MSSKSLRCPRLPQEREQKQQAIAEDSSESIAKNAIVVNSSAVMYMQRSGVRLRRASSADLRRLLKRTSIDWKSSG